MTTEVDKAVQEALNQRDAEENRTKADVTTGTYVWAIVAALCSPLIGAGYGIYQLTQGRTKKGWTYIGIAVVGFVLTFAVLSG